MTVDMTIGLIDVHKPEIRVLYEDGTFEDKIADEYEFVIRKCPKLDYNLNYKVCYWALNESSFNINNQAFGFFWNVVAPEISEIIKLKDQCAMVAPDALEKFGMEHILVSPMFCFCDDLIAPLKPLLEHINNLPDSFSYKEIGVEDNDFLGDVVTWLKYWSAKALKLYDEDAYIEFR